MEKEESQQEIKFKKGSWKPEEDLLLTRYIETHGEGKWKTVSKRSGLMRGGKSCRLRWKNYLRPNLKHGEMSAEEEDLIIRMHKLLGNRWSLIAGRLPGRTDNEVKNYWNTHLIKRYPQCIKRVRSSESSSNKRKKVSHSPNPPTINAAQMSPHSSNSNGCDAGSSDKQETVTDSINSGSSESQKLQAISNGGCEGTVAYENPPWLASLDSYSSISVESFHEKGSEWWSWLESPLYFPEDIMYPTVLP
ncbi:hypothetical protein NE237_025510 [Protea cynaroides]|uniref:Uncharacterized protein n=1 Tax=Protea cynaroides TaxID=273540 RepID=A0A9Q0JZK7_9MAGN|nr:hypothetical protein NE237_025510 [Protea cynaroides]